MAHLLGTWILFCSEEILEGVYRSISNIFYQENNRIKKGKKIVSFFDSETSGHLCILNTGCTDFNIYIYLYFSKNIHTSNTSFC